MGKATAYSAISSLMSLYPDETISFSDGHREVSLYLEDGVYKVQYLCHNDVTIHFTELGKAVICFLEHVDTPPIMVSQTHDIPRPATPSDSQMEDVMYKDGDE